MDALQELLALQKEIEQLRIERRLLRNSLYQRQKRLMGKTIEVDGQVFDAYELSTFSTGSWRMQSPRTNLKKDTSSLDITLQKMRSTRDILKQQVTTLKRLKSVTTMSALKERAKKLVESRKNAAGSDITSGARTGAEAHYRFSNAVDKTDEATANWLRSISSDAVFDMLDNLDPDEDWYTREDFNEAARKFYESQKLDDDDPYDKPDTRPARQ